MSRAKPVEVNYEDEEERPRLTLVEAAGEESVPPAAGGVPPEEERDALEAAPADVVVCIDSLGVSLLDRFSLVRVFREEWRSKVAFYRSKEGGEVPLEKAIEYATHQVDEEYGAQILERLLTESAETIDFEDLHKLWMSSPEDAEFVWANMKREARREFITGHLAATVFEPVDWMKSAWKRAKFLGVRDSFIDEYEPEGGVEVALVDTMAQAYFLQLHWTEESVRRTQTDPRRRRYEYARWERYKRETCKEEMWEDGYWEVPYASEVECQEQAVRMADHFSRLFQRSVRALDNHRLAKAKLRRMSVPSARVPAVEQERAHDRERGDRLEKAQRTQESSSVGGEP
jgi:hypothetical protein